MNLFEKAAREGWRFESSKGLLTVEDLFGMPLKATTGCFDLDNVAQRLHGKVTTAEVSHKSFVDDSVASNTEAVLKEQLDLVVYIINSKKDERKAREEARERVAYRNRIQDLIAAKKAAALENLSVEDLENLLK